MVTNGTLTALQIAARVRRGETSAEQVALAHLARIDELDENLGAFREVDRERVLADARAVDQDAARRSGPLAGVPVAIKDNVDVLGLSTRFGSAATPTVPPSPTTSWCGACARRAAW